MATRTPVFFNLATGLLEQLQAGDTLGVDGLVLPFTEGSVPFIGPAGLLSEDNADFFYDSGAIALGIGLNTPTGTIHVLSSGALVFQGTFEDSSGTGGAFANWLSNTAQIQVYVAHGPDGGGIFAFTGTELVFETNGPQPIVFLTHAALRASIDSAGNLLLGNIVAAGGSAAGVLALSNGATAPTNSADLAQLWAQDLSAANATLAMRVETAVAADVGLASTNSLTVFINGSKYKIPLVFVP